MPPPYPPPQRTAPAPALRRPGEPAVHERDIADRDGTAKKRRRGAARLSCAECRRLKLRCDRKVPCDSCVKRGCASICPDGSLTTGKGNRFVLASTQELHEKISELCSRVRELEDALRAAYSQIADDKHPLLTDDLLRIKAPLQRETNADRPADGAGGKDEQGVDVVDSFGSLSISQSGRTKYFGHTANSWYFLQNETLEEDQDHDDRVTGLENVLPPEILALRTAFPPSSPGSSPTAETERLRSLFWYLPPLDKATDLRDRYYERAAWMYNPIPMQQFNENVFVHFYHADSAPMMDDSAGAHRLALMFMVLAIGTLMDPKQVAYGLEAEKYHQLARAALFSSSMSDDPTLNAVQAVFLMSLYLFLADRHGTSSGSRWTIMGIAVKLAQSIGLHRDSNRWGVDADESLRRSETFWELYTYDSWQCLTFGRPPSFALAHVDCKLPYPADDPTGEQSFHTWKYKFASECMSIVHDQAFGAKTPSYQTILQLDRKLRAFPVPSILQVAGFGSSDPDTKTMYPDTLTLIMQRHIVLAIREMNLLYMHRGFFARAISDHPKDPLGSPYGTSVIAAYRSAGSLVALVRNLDSQLPEPTERLWFLWTHLFSCSVILGSIVTRCPSMSLAPSALVQLDSACELFSRVARTFRAEKVQSIMLGLRQKAHHALIEFREGRTLPHGTPYAPVDAGSPGTNEGGDDELAILGGKTRLISQKDPSKSPSPLFTNRSPISLNPVVPLPLQTADGYDVHPNVVEYLQTFAPTTSPLALPLQTDPALYHAHAPQMFGASRPPLDVPYDYTGEQQLHSPSSSGSVPGAGVRIDQLAGAAHARAPHAGLQAQLFPQYFPVFDYPPAGGESAFPPMQTNGHAHTHSGSAAAGSSNAQVQGYAQGGAYGDVSAAGYGDRRRDSSGSDVDMHMQTTWMDLVAQMGMSG